MDNQTITVPSDMRTLFAVEDENFLVNSSQLTNAKGSELEGLYATLSKTYVSTFDSLAASHSISTPHFYPYQKMNTPEIIWINYANELISHSLLSNPAPKKRLDTEIVKRFSLFENVQKIYFNQVSHYINVDVTLDCETITDDQFESFFEYEKELLNLFNTPINFNYYFKNTFYVHPDNILIFEK